MCTRYVVIVQFVPFNLNKNVRIYENVAIHAKHRSKGGGVPAQPLKCHIKCPDFLLCMHNFAISTNFVGQRQHPTNLMAGYVDP